MNSINQLPVLLNRDSINVPIGQGTNSHLTNTLKQGAYFNKYQRKIKKNLEKGKSYKILEGFNGSGNGSGSIFGENTQPTSLDIQSQRVLDDTSITDSEIQQLNNLKEQYNTLLSNYDDLKKQSSTKMNNYISRSSNTNPYSNSNVCLNNGNGACGYVNNAGVFKWYPADNGATYNSTAGKNGCPATGYKNVSANADGTVAGNIIPTTPNLLSGDPMVSGQSCGYEGQNVYVNSVVSNPTSTYVGCYNDKPLSQNIIFIPVMNNTNNVNGFVSSASSVYQNNNSACGPWGAFDQNKNTYWHSNVSSDNDYDSKSGAYLGVNGMSFIDSNSSSQYIKGEYLRIDMPGVNANTGNLQSAILYKYDIQGRQDCCGTPNGRNPNSWYILGYNASSNQWSQIDYQQNQNFDKEVKTYLINNPQAYSSFMILITVCGNSNNTDGSRYCVQISQWNLYSSSDYNFNDSDRAMIWNPSSIGYTDYSTCQQYAMDNGYTYFGMQNLQGNGTAACLVSNDVERSQQYGKAIGNVALWASNTATSETSYPGVNASLTVYGSLTVYNSGGSSSYSTPNTVVKPDNYLGCYNDCGSSGRALSSWLNGTQNDDYTKCFQQAQSAGLKYFGLQFTQPNGLSECWASNDIDHGRMYGKANNCTNNGTNIVGGSCSNAIYSIDPGLSSYYLLLEDNGNMSIHLGTGPNDDQQLVWESGTKGSQQQANSAYAATNGKFGQNWMLSGSTMAIGDWIGSPNGSIYLIMQNDGNLVLYTSSSNSDVCSKMPDGNKAGGSWINAIYKLNDSGYPDLMGKVAYIDQNSKLVEYPSSMLSYKNEYTKLANTNSAYNDINGAIANQTAETCKTYCNETENCAGFVFDNNSGNCWPKNSGMFPNGEKQFLEGADTYIRTPDVIPPTGVSKQISNIDSVKYNNYIKSNVNMSNFKGGFSGANSVIQQQLSQMQDQLNSIASDIANKTTNIQSKTLTASQQIELNRISINTNDRQIKVLKNILANQVDNSDGILRDSDIIALKENYSYLLWSILAIGVVIISMNAMK